MSILEYDEIGDDPTFITDIIVFKGVLDIYILN